MQILVSIDKNQYRLCSSDWSSPSDLICRQEHQYFWQKWKKSRMWNQWHDSLSLLLPDSCSCWGCWDPQLQTSLTTATAGRVSNVPALPGRKPGRALKVTAQASRWVSRVWGSPAAREGARSLVLGIKLHILWKESPCSGELFFFLKSLFFFFKSPFTWWLQI